jgi:hypothetical protein
MRQWRSGSGFFAFVYHQPTRSPYLAAHHHQSLNQTHASAQPFKKQTQASDSKR